MAGLIDTAISGAEEKDILAPGKTLQAGSVGIEPEKRTVDANETVAGQLDDILKTDSPLLQRARARANEMANSRGLVNSTMAAQAGEAAVIDAALPIASADAGTQNMAKRENMAATNTALQMNADATNKATLVNTDAANQVALQNLRGEQANTLAEVEANYKSIIQSSQSAAVAFDTASKSITAIMADTNTSQAQKQRAVNTIAQILQASLHTAGQLANVDIAQLLDFTVPA